MDFRETGKACTYRRLMLAEGHLTRARFAAILRRIAMLLLPVNWNADGKANHGECKRMDGCRRN